MPDLTRGHTYGASSPDNEVTHSNLNNLVGNATINDSAVTEGKIDDGAITNAKINTSAEIALSKLAAGATDEAQIIVSADVTGIPTYVTVAGDVTITNTGGSVIGAGKVQNSMLAADVQMVPAGAITQYAAAAAPTGWLLCNGDATLNTYTYRELHAVISNTYGGTAYDAGTTDDEAATTEFTLPDLKGRIPIGAGQQTNTKHSTVDLTDCGTTDTDATVTTGDTSSLVVGMEVRGAGIPTGATIDSIVADTSFELSVVATATADPVTLTFGPLYLGTGTDFALAAVGGAEDHKVTIAEMPSHTHTVSHGQSVTKRGDSANEAAGYLGTGPTLSTGDDDPHNILQPYIVLNYIIKT